MVNPEVDDYVKRKIGREACLRSQVQILIERAAEVLEEEKDEAGLRVVDDMLSQARTHLSALLMGEAMSR